MDMKKNIIHYTRFLHSWAYITKIDVYLYLAKGLCYIKNVFQAKVGNIKVTAELLPRNLAHFHLCPLPKKVHSDRGTLSSLITCSRLVMPTLTIIVSSYFLIRLV